MTAIWYSAEDDRLVIEGALQTYAPRTLMAVLDGDQIMIRLKVNSRNEFGPAPYTAIHDATGAGFADGAAALAYLQGEFARRPAVPDLVSPYIARADLGGHRVVCAVPGGVNLASSDDADTAGAAIGVTTAAAAAGAPVPVVTHGPVVEPSWSFAIGPVYLGRDGLLTQEAPTAGCVLRIGRATAPTVLLVEIDEPFFLAA